MDDGVKNLGFSSKYSFSMVARARGLEDGNSWLLYQIGKAEQCQETKHKNLTSFGLIFNSTNTIDFRRGICEGLEKSRNEQCSFRKIANCLWSEKVKMDAILPNKNTALSLAFYPWERTIFFLHTSIYLQLYPHRVIIVFSYLLQQLSFTKKTQRYYSLQVYRLLRVHRQKQKNS